MGFTVEENKALDWWRSNTDFFKETMFFKYRKMFIHTYAEPMHKFQDLGPEDILRIYQAEIQPIEQRQIFKMFSEALMVKDDIWKEYCHTCKKEHYMVFAKCSYCFLHAYKQPFFNSAISNFSQCKAHYPCACEQKAQDNT